MSVRRTLSTATIAATALVVALAVPRFASAVMIDQVDTFEDGTTQDWVVGPGAHPAPPINVPTDGPAGAGDHFLQLTAVGGSGAGSRLTVINDTQWAGNYLAAGVTGIEMDVKNLGDSTLALRVLFQDPPGVAPVNIAVSTAAIALAAGSGWIHVVFPIAPSDLTATLGSVDSALTDATEMRIFHGTTANFPGEQIVAQLGVDNIRAVPEPDAAIGIALAIGALAVTRLRASPPG
jgi:hypothetical protein